MKTIIITGGAINGNTGAEAMVVTALRRIRERIPESRFVIFTPYYTDDRRVWDRCIEADNIFLADASPLVLAGALAPFSILAGACRRLGLDFLKPFFPEAVRRLWEADLLIDVAGVAFIDSRPKFLPFNLLSIYPGFLMGVPVIKFAQALGPFQKKLNRLLGRHCLKQCTHIAARGARTLAHLRELGISGSRVSLSTDVAFLHRTGDAVTRENAGIDRLLARLKDLPPEVRRVGVCPSSVVLTLTGGQGLDYLGLLERTCLDLIRLGHHPVLFPNATKEHRKGLRNNDIPLIRDLAGRLETVTSPDSFSRFDRNLNTDGVKSVIQTLDVCVVSRFHAMVFALTLKTPVFILGWSHKYLEVMEQFGLQQYVVDWTTLDDRSLTDAVMELVARRAETADRIGQCLDAVQRSAQAQISAAVRLLESRPEA